MPPTANAANAPSPLSAFLLHEVDPAWSREKVALAPAVSVTVGTVLSCSNKLYQPIDFAGTGAAKTAAAVAMATEAVPIIAWCSLPIDMARALRSMSAAWICLLPLET